MVCWSVCLSVGRHDHEPCKNGWTDRDPNQPSFALRDPLGPWKRVRWRSRSPYMNVQLSEEKLVGRGHSQTHLTIDVLKANQQGQHWCDKDANWGVLDGVHIGATWQIQLNLLCAAAMRLCQIALTTCYCFHRGHNGDCHCCYLLLQQERTVPTCRVLCRQASDRRCEPTCRRRRKNIDVWRAHHAAQIPALMLVSLIYVYFIDLLSVLIVL